jgi:UDP-N-acetylmuramoyl-tripeptide--D-alanyl-D-alanine ligase
LIELAPEAIAEAMGADVVRVGGPGSPERAVIDSRDAAAGALFFGLTGGSSDGGAYAAAALEAGAWGAVVEHGRGEEAAAAPGEGWVFATADPLEALQRLARAWRRELGAQVVGITGSVGKTSVKDITAALLPGRVHASPQNYNTEIGLPLTVLEAPPDTDVLVLEMAMRGPGQIAELAEIAEPDVAVVTNIGPVHIELLGSVAAIAAVKAEILAGLPAGGAAVVPTDAGELEPHLEGLPRVIRFGEGGDVRVLESRVVGERTEARIATPAGEAEFVFPFTEAHNLTNALAAIGGGVALGVAPGDMAAGAADVGFSRLRGEHLRLGDGIVLVNDCYNANPVSMRAALDHLASIDSDRRVAVLGVMAELGPDAPAFHAEVGAHARDAGIDLVIGVGEEARGYDPDELVATPEDAAELLAAQLGPGDAVLVKGSRSAGLEAVAEALTELLADEAVQADG